MKCRRLYYHCYDTDKPTGGQKSTYQHVDVLNGCGYNAYVVHSTPGYRLRWFENNTKVITWEEVWRTFDSESDVLVFPETFGARLLELPGNKVLFNKNVYYGFLAFGNRPLALNPYYAAKLLGIMVVSEHNEKHLRFAYPDLAICRVTHNIAEERFPFVPLSAKRWQGAYISSKAVSPLMSILHTFTARAERGYNRGADFKWIKIEGKTEDEVSRILRESLIVLFPSAEEGLGRFPLEALLSGCVVLTFDIGPMDEYIPAAFRCKYMDISATVAKIENVLASAGKWDSIQDQVSVGRSNAVKYSAAAQRDTVCAAWETFLRYS